MVRKLAERRSLNIRSQIVQSVGTQLSTSSSQELSRNGSLRDSEDIACWGLQRCFFFDFFFLFSPDKKSQKGQGKKPPCCEMYGVDWVSFDILDLAACD